MEQGKSYTREEVDEEKVERKDGVGGGGGGGEG